MHKRCEIEQIVVSRVTPAQANALASREGVDDLRSPTVVFHAGGICLGVGDHPSLCANHCEPAAEDSSGRFHLIAKFPRPLPARIFFDQLGNEQAVVAKPLSGALEIGFAETVG